MLAAAVSLLTPWANYYVLIGTAAASLTGLQFVVVTLIARMEGQGSDNDGLAAFGTPTVVHFCTALAVATIFSAPWHTLWHAGLLLSLVGLAGVGYIVVVVRRVRRQSAYRPVLEDWLWHVVFPLISYVALAIAALLLPHYSGPTLFVIGAATVLLLFIGIHNAWDTVTYLVSNHFQQQAEHPD
jgi:hypothetical protein